MAFDPDAYLAKKAAPTGGGFDPDAYLASRALPDTIANPGNTTPEVSQSRPADSEGVSIGRALLPRSFKAEEEGAGIIRKSLAGAGDALSLPGRFATAQTETQQLSPGGNKFGYMGGGLYQTPQDSQRYQEREGTDRSMAESMADTKGRGIAQQVARDPALIPSLAMGGPAAKAGAGLVTKFAPSLGKAATNLARLSTAGAIEGGTSAAIHQADRASQGEDVNLGQAAIETAVGAALPPALIGTGMAVKGAAKWTNKMLGKTAQELSGVSEEALRKFGSGFGEGAKELQAAAGTQHDVGKKLVGMLDNLDDFLPEKEIVDKALKEMPAVNVSGTLDALEATKTGGALKSGREVNTKITELIADLRGAADDAGNIPAAEFRGLRKEVDELIGDAFGKESGRYVTALKKARHQMAEDLAVTAEAGGNPEYVQAMRSMADKLRKADDLKQFLGKSAQTRDARAESFVSTLFGKNKEERRRAVAAMGEIFGEDFLKESKLANLAAELGDEGKAGLLPRQFTGRSALGPILGGSAYAVGAGGAVAPALALSSPRLASGLLSGANQVERGLGVASDALATRPTSTALRLGLFQGDRR